MSGLSGYRGNPIVLGSTPYGRVFNVEIGWAGATYTDLVETVRAKWGGWCRTDSWYAYHSQAPWHTYMPIYATATVYLPKPTTVKSVRDALYPIGWDIVSVKQRV